MKSYVLLVRGINVGGKNKVVMSEWRAGVTALGFVNVTTYINSGNFFFQSDLSREEICQCLKTYFEETYPFIQHFSLIEKSDFLKEIAGLPNWWQEELARKDVLFYTEGLDSFPVMERIKAFSLGDEQVHFGRLGIYWGKNSEKEYLKTAYHKQLIKEKFYKKVTIRNAKTVAKIVEIFQTLSV